MIKPVNGTITSRFDEPRPLSNPGKHIHGAIDIAARTGEIIRAPEAGDVFCYVAIRQTKKQIWPELIALHNRSFPFLNYFYDVFGGIIVLQAHDKNIRAVKRTHIIAHCYGNQIFEKSIFKEYQKHWIEESKNKRFPIHAIYTDNIIVEAGDLIGFVGNAGYSTGPHIHHEIHHGYKWERWEDRIDPEKYYE